MKGKFPVKNPDIVVRMEDTEALLFNPSDGNLLCINGTGMLIWDLCDGTHSVGEIAEDITSKQEVSLKEAQDDCIEFLKDLEKPGFMTYKT